MAEAPHHGGLPTWVWVVGGGAVAVIGAIVLLGQGQQTASTNAPSQSADGATTGTGTTTGTVSDGVAEGSVEIPQLSASGQVEPLPAAGSSELVSGNATGSPEVVLVQQGSQTSGTAGMSSTGTPVWWLPSGAIADLSGVSGQPTNNNTALSTGATLPS